MTEATDKRRAILRLIAYAMAERRLLTQALALLLIATAADVGGPLLIKIFIDDFVMTGRWDVTPIALLGVAYVALLTCTALTNYMQAVRLGALAVRAVQRLREQVFAKVMQMPLTFFDRTPTGSLISRITNDTEYVKELYVHVLGAYVQNIARMAAIFIAMAFLDWRLMLVCLVFVPLVALLMFFYQRRSTPLFHKARALLSDINTQLHESIQGMKVIQITGQAARFQRQFASTTEEHYQARLRNLRLDSYMLRPLIDMLHLLTLAVLLFTFGYQSLGAAVQVGVIYAFVSYLGRFTEPIIEMTQRLSLYQQAVVAGERVFELLDTPVETRHERAEFTVHHGDIHFQNITFSYDGQRDVIKNLSAHIPAGQFHAVVGHTGSGKSTLANLLLRFYAPRAGEIMIDGAPLREYAEAELRARVGVVQQDPFIFSGTVRDNITLGLPIGEEEMLAASRQAGLHEHAQRLPQGYDTVLTERGANLSTGQRQLLALARTLARKPKILILDEATANIDSHTEARIQEALMTLRGEITLLVIAHRLSTVEKADRIWVMHQGEVAQQGSHAELLRAPGLYRTLHELQALSAATAE